MSLGLAGRKPEEYTLRLREAMPGTPFVFVCPVCRKGFRTEDEARCGACRAHIIPEALGGSKKTMVCRECDSAIGARIEGPVVKVMNDNRVMSAKLAGKVRNPVHITTPAGKLNCAISYSEKLGRRVTLSGSPDAHRALADARSKAGPTQRVVVPLTYVHDREHVNRAHELLLLKIAYYAAFEHLLFEYALRPDVKWVGQFLLGTDGFSPPYQFALAVPPDKTEGMTSFNTRTREIVPTVTVFIDGTLDNEPAVLCYVTLQEQVALVILPPRRLDPGRLCYRTLRGPHRPDVTHTISTFFGMTFD